MPKLLFIFWFFHNYDIAQYIADGFIVFICTLVQWVTAGSWIGVTLHLQTKEHLELQIRGEKIILHCMFFHKSNLDFILVFMYAPDEDARDTSVCDGDSGYLSEKDLSFAELSFGNKSNFTVITCWPYLLQVFFHTCGVCVLMSPWIFRACSRLFFNLPVICKIEFF